MSAKMLILLLSIHPYFLRLHTGSEEYCDTCQRRAICQQHSALEEKEFPKRHNFPKIAVLMRSDNIFADLQGHTTKQCGSINQRVLSIRLQQISGTDPGFT